MVGFSSVPSEIKPLAHLLKLAKDHDQTNILVVSYWARMSAYLLAEHLVPTKKSPETCELIRKLFDWLEETKKANHDNEGITNKTVAKAMIEEYALKMFRYGSLHDKYQIFNKNTVKSFYTAGMLMDVLEQFGSLSDDLKQKRKYAKWKAVYIHNSLKSGELPLPGPPRGVHDQQGGIIHNSSLSEEELATYKQYTGSIPFGSEQMEKLLTDKPVSTDTPLLDNFCLSFASHMPTLSPIQPVVPQEPAVPQEPVIPQQPAIPQQPVIPEQPTTPLVLPLIPSSDNAEEPQLDTTLLPATPSREQVPVFPEHIQKAQMYCEFITSALKYDDIECAVENIHKALNLLHIGSESLNM